MRGVTPGKRVPKGAKGARALMAETTGLCDRAREIHSLSRTATAALGRLLTGAAGALTGF